MTAGVDPAVFPFAYHVAYQFNDVDERPGFGSITIFRRQPVGTPGDLESMKATIVECSSTARLRVAGIVILSWQRFEGWGK